MSAPSNSQVDISNAESPQRKLTRRSTKPSEDGFTETTVVPEHEAPRSDIAKVNGPSSPVVTAEPASATPVARSDSGLLSSLRRVVTINLEHKPLAKPPSALVGIKEIICSSWLNLLLLCIPVSWALHFVWKHPTDTQDAIIFTFAFLAIIPLAALLSFATDELSMRVGQTLAGLLNATLGNAVELIVAIIALTKCELQIVQSSLVGSILSNILLVLGMCYFAGGVLYPQQKLGESASVSMNPTLLMVIVIAGLFPACFHAFAGDLIEDHAEGQMILSISHGIAIILLIIYIGYLVFQLVSHKNLYSDEHIMPSGKYSEETKRTVRKWVMWLPHRHHRATPARQGTGNEVEGQSIKSDESIEQPKLSVWMTVGLLLVVTVFVAVTAEFLVDSINGLADTGKISKEFIGLVLLPIVGNAAEHYTAITASIHDKGVLAVSVAVGSSIQIALFVIPFIVTLGWIIGSSLTFLFDPAESAVLFLSVLAVNYTMGDGESNWLEGLILMGLYAIIAVFFWYYPGVNVAGNLVTC